MFCLKKVSLSPDDGYGGGRVDSGDDLEIVLSGEGFYDRIMGQLDAGKAIILSMLILVILALVVLMILSLLKEMSIRRYVKNKIKQGYKREQIEIDLLRKGLKQSKVNKLLK